ncbi:hypothetical protein [Methylobacterium sp. E-005]|uniref:hypothetical protein n=1 Tax=Methylobacterium sp. E-005 TaxID=2836549 RepID=UPI001FB9E888|nr:hypothetical protein [Methylobacterium sp. E-005]
MLFFEKRAGVYYLHRLTAGGIISGQICGSPYSSDVWSSSSVTGTYTYIGATVVPGASGAADSRDGYASCMVLDGAGTYHLFYSSTTSDPIYQVGRSTGTAPGGPFTKVSAAILPAAIKGQPENPEVFYHSGLGCWVMLTNQVNVSAGKTVSNRAFFSASLTDWSAASFCDYQRICPMDGANVIGLPRAARSSAANNLPVIDTASNALGAVAQTYDTNPTSANDFNHVGRKILWSALEPAAKGLLFTAPAGAAPLFQDDFSTETAGTLGGQNGWVDYSGSNAKPVVVAANGSVPAYLNMQSSVGASLVVNTKPGVVTQPAAFSMKANFAANCGVGFVFGYGTSSVSFFHFDFDDVGCAIAWVNASGSETTPASVSYSSVAGVDTVFQATVQNGTIVLTANGTKVLTYTPTASDQIACLSNGGSIGLRNGYPGNGTRIVRSFSYSVPASAGVAKTLTRSLTHANFVAEFAVMFDTSVSGGYCDLFYRLQSTTDLNNGYRLRLSAGTPIASAVAVDVAGVDYPITGMGTDVQATQGVLANFWHRVKLTVQGNRHQVFVDGEKQADFVDANFLSGVALALSAAGSNSRFRLMSLRSGDEVAVTGLTPGQVVTLRGPAGMPITSKVAKNDTVLLRANHYPQTSIDVGGVDVLAPSGGIWGGDVIAYPISGGGQPLPGFRPGFH